MADRSSTPPIPSKAAITRIYKGNRVIGAGFLVEGGVVLTCAHVVRDALALQSDTPALGKQVRVNFPYLSLRKKLTAKVLFYRYAKGEDDLDEDMAGLRIVDSLPAEARPARLESHHKLREPYQVVGFPKGHAKGIGSYGCLLERLPNGLVQMEDTKTQGLAILPGFSGTPVWGETTGAVVGMVVAREKDQPEAKIGFMMPGERLRAEVTAFELSELLSAVAEGQAEALKLAYRLCCPQIGPIPETLPEQLARLQDTPRGTRLFEPVDQFVGLLSLPVVTPDPAMREPLRQWLQRRKTDLQPLLAEAQRLWDQHQATQTTDAPSHLLIYVQDESTEARSVSALFVPDAQQYAISSGRGGEPVQAPGQAPFHEKVTLATLPALVQACLDEVLKQSPRRLRLHLRLPLAWLQQAHDHWPMTNGSSNPVLALLKPQQLRIGVHYCCAVGIAERLNPDILKLFQEPWQQKWKQLVSLQPGDLCSALVSGDDVVAGPDLQVKLNSATKIGLKLSTVYDESQYLQLFATLIATGTPTALWLRSDQFADTVSAATDLERVLACKIATLPDTIKQCRTDALAAADDGHIGHHLSFLWDDPTLVPPSTDLSLAMPQP